MGFLSGRRAADRDAEIRQDLVVGLHTVTEINHAIRYADTKAGALAAVQALIVTILVTKPDHALPPLAVAACLGAVLMSAVLLALGQFPRLSGHPRATATSRIGFPTLAAMALDDVVATPSLKA